MKLTPTEANTLGLQIELALKALNFVNKIESESEYFELKAYPMGNDNQLRIDIKRKAKQHG